MEDEIIVQEVKDCTFVDCTVEIGDIHDERFGSGNQIIDCRFETENEL